LAQSTPEYDAINPNNKMPLIIDRAPAGGGTPFTVFESGAILAGGIGPMAAQAQQLARSPYLVGDY
jgi:hypothetical protein